MFQDVNGDAEHISGANFTFDNNLKALFSSSKCVDSVSIPMSIPTDIIEGSICLLRDPLVDVSKVCCCKTGPQHVVWKAKRIQ